MVGSISAVLNGLSRGVWAAIMDKLGFKKVFFALLCLEVLSCVAALLKWPPLRVGRVDRDIFYP